MSASNNSLIGLYKKADRIMLFVIWFLFAISLGLADWYYTWNLSIWIGLPLALIPTALIFLKPGHRITRVSVAVAFMLFCALHIHQAMGVTELHFGIFVLLAVLLTYRDWLVIIAAAVVAAVHHLSFNYLQQLGFPAYCFTDPSLGRVVAHAVYVVFEASVLCYIAIWMRRDAYQAAELETLVNTVTQDGKVNLNVDGGTISSPAGKSLVEMIHTIGNAIFNVRENAVAIDNVLMSMNNSNAAVSSGAQEQANAIYGATEQINGMVSLLTTNENRAKQAGQDISKTVDLAQEGESIMQQSVQSMDQMAELSKQIAEITGLIDSIAFQTNILALNASVEAARAGENGRGFAVVAGEVRILAQRSADASHQIRELINTSVSQVVEGSNLINKSGLIMSDLTGSVQALNQILSEMLGANSDQLNSIKSLEQIMNRVQGIAEGNIQSAQESGALVENLDKGAQNLNRAVGLITN